MSETEKSRNPRFLHAVNKQTKLSLQIQQKSSDSIYEYQIYLREKSNAEVTPGSLVSAFINAAVNSDKGFVEWKKKREVNLKKVVSDQINSDKKPPETNDANPLQVAHRNDELLSIG